MANPLNNIHQIADFFYKKAGILEVPEKLLNEISAWAKGIFCKKLEKNTYTILYRLKERNELGQDLLKITSSPTFDKFRDKVDLAKQSGELDDLFEVLKLLNNGADFKIAHFDDKINKKTNIQGTYDWTGSWALEIAIRHLENKNCNFFLRINYYENEINIKEMNISIEEAAKILKKYISIIYSIIDHFIYFVNNDFEIYDKSYIKRIGFIRGMCSKYINEKYTNPQQFIFDMDASKYFDKGKLKKEKDDFFKDTNNQLKINCKYIFSKYEQENLYPASNWSGLYKGNGNIYLFSSEKELDPEKINEKELEETINEIGITARHELQHLMQDYMRGANGDTGLPSRKIRTPNHNMSGIDKKNPEAKRLDHELRDVEFYTRVADTVDHYKSVIKNVPLEARSTFFKVWTAQVDKNELENVIEDIGKKQKRDTRYLYDTFLIYVSPKLDNANYFFSKLKNAQPLKYNKAVKETYKVLSSAGLV